MADFVNETTLMAQLQDVLHAAFPPSPGIKHHVQQLIRLDEGMRVADYILLHHAYGFFVFELKSYSIAMITDVTPDSWKLENHRFDNPYQRLQQQVQAIKRTLNDPAPGYGLLVLPGITRQQWADSGFSDTAIPYDHLLFSEDIEPAAIKNRLIKVASQDEL